MTSYAKPRLADLVLLRVSQRPNEIAIWSEAEQLTGRALVSSVYERSHELTKSPQGWAVISSTKSVQVLVDFLAGLHAGKTVFLGGKLSPAVMDRVPPASVVVFSSGTTNAPKGIILSHQNWMNNVGASLAHIPVIEGRPAFCLNPATHVSGLRFSLQVLSAGASIYFPEKNWPVMLADIRPRVISGNPSVFNHPNLDSTPPVELTKIVTIGGADAPESLIIRLKRIFPKSDVLMLHGLSECTSLLFSRMWGPGQPLGCLGSPVPGMEYRISDPITTGAGRLEVRGSSLMIGYVGAEPIPQGAWLFTGDWATQLSSGDVQLLGREGEWVDRDGERYFFSTISRALLTYPGIEDAHVSSSPLPSPPHSVTAWIKLAPNTNEIPAEIFNKYGWLNATTVPFIPRRSNGKINTEHLLTLTKRGD